MKLRFFKKAAFTTILCISLAQFGVYVDDIEHIGQPDPNCPICQVINAQVVITEKLELNLTPDVVVGIVPAIILGNYSCQCISHQSTRAPPFSS